jgi:hypothetical protein
MQDKGEEDWMTRYFFSGGTMPSLDLLMYFPEHVAIQKHWWGSALPGRAALALLGRCAAGAECRSWLLLAGAPCTLHPAPGRQQQSGRAAAPERTRSAHPHPNPHPAPHRRCRYVNGSHYSRTLEAWLRNQDNARAAILPIFEKAYGSKASALKW